MFDSVCPSPGGYLSYLHRSPLLPPPPSRILHARRVLLRICNDVLPAWMLPCSPSVLNKATERAWLPYSTASPVSRDSHRMDKRRLMALADRPKVSIQVSSNDGRSCSLYGSDDWHPPCMTLHDMHIRVPQRASRHPHVNIELLQ